MKHSKLPFRNDMEYIFSPDEQISHNVHKADARFIVKACNNYYEMKEIIESTLTNDWNMQPKAYYKIKKLLKKLED